LAEDLGPIQDDLRKLYTAQFAGLWIDTNGVAQVRFVGDGNGVRDVVVAAGLANAPHLAEVGHSEAELMRVMGQLRTDYQYLDDGTLTLGGVQLAKVYLDIPRNAVVLEALSGSAEEWSKLEARYGSAVVIEQAESSAAPVACTSRSNCGGPMKAGLWMFYLSGERACTTAFQVFTASANYILTAGHCHSNSNTRYHPVGTKIGAQQAYSTSGRADAMTIYLSSASSVSNKLFLTPTNIISITRAEQISGSVDAEVLGERVCISKGSATGNRCGTLLHTMVDLGGGLTDQRMASNMWACGGDSGSPVYDGSKAIGVISQGSKGSTGTVECGQQGANSFYSHIYWVQDELNVALRIS
jgi:hypothetical protein